MRALPAGCPGFDSTRSARGCVIEEVHIQIPVTVVVEEHSLRRKAGMDETILFGPVGEGAVAVVDVEDVPSVHVEVVDTRDIDVELSVAIHIGHRDARLPSLRVGDASLVGDVLELIVALVAIELVRADVGREVEIGQAVAVDIAYRDATTIVVVEVVEDIEVSFFRQLVGEAHARCRGREQLEQWRRSVGSAFAPRRRAPTMNARIEICRRSFSTRLPLPLPASRLPLFRRREPNRLASAWSEHDTQVGLRVNVPLRDRDWKRIASTSSRPGHPRRSPPRTSAGREEVERHGERARFLVGDRAEEPVGAAAAALRATIT